VPGGFKILNYEDEVKKRVSFIKSILLQSNAKGIIYGNSGGKDSALVGILCKMATNNTLGVIMPCGSKQNYGDDKSHALLVAQKFEIETQVVELTDVKDVLLSKIEPNIKITEASKNNINPRVRMTTLYAIGQSKGYIVAGTGNKSEIYMGYFTKYGDGGADFNPIADLTATQILEFLTYLKAPIEIIQKPPSAGLYDGQTDEKEMGVTYKSLDKYLQTGEANEQDKEVIQKAHKISEHKRHMPFNYEG
jgi:NAD+ synthase